MGGKESDFELEDPWGRTSVAAAAKLFLRHALLAWAVSAQHGGVFGAPPAALHVVLGLASLGWRLFCAHGGGHRYFAHRAFETTRALELAMAVTIQATDMGALQYWANVHERHHTHCEDTAGRDPHSPRHLGFWRVQLGLGLHYPPALMRDVSKLRTAYRNDLSWLTIQKAAALALVEDFFWLFAGAACALAAAALGGGGGADISASSLGGGAARLWLWARAAPQVAAYHLTRLTNSAGQ